MSQQIAIIGGGSWATALVKILSVSGHSLVWWLRKESSVTHILEQGYNPDYLRDVEINLERVRPMNNLSAVIADSTHCILAVPSAFLESTLEGIQPEIWKDKFVYSAIKGIIPSRNQILGDYLNSVQQIPYSSIGIITGPCHAEEVALGRLSYLTVASENPVVASDMARWLECSFIKTTVSDDINGTEYSAVLKNIMAIASGICHGLGYGDNFHAVLISNAIREIKHFVDRVHPITRDINDSAYLGDLLVTAYSQFSRNRNFGNMIGKGYTVQSANLEMNMIAEGYYASACIERIASEKNIDLPICRAVYRILYEKAAVAAEIRKLTERLT